MDAPSNRSAAIDNLMAFTRLYGWVRFFHPSDEAAELDWETFAVLGARRVKEASGPEELCSVLRSLFLPVAPTLRISTAEDEFSSVDSEVGDDEDLQVVAWQHKGVEFDKAYRIFRSVRLNRQPVRGARGVGRISKAIDAEPYRGREVKLGGTARLGEPTDDGDVKFQLRVNRPDIRDDVIENTEPIAEVEWTDADVVARVPDDAVRIWITCMYGGNGAAYVDRVEFSVRDEVDEWGRVPISNGDFGDSEVGWMPVDWSPAGKSYTFDVTDLDDGRGRVAEIESFSYEPLFDECPDPGEVLDLDLGCGLAARMPVALYSRDGHTVGRRDDYPLHTLEDALENVESLPRTIDDEDVRLAAVVVAWNVLQHFFPYFEVLETDWSAVLPRTLRGVFDCESSNDFVELMDSVVVELQDGHAHAWFAHGRGHANLPILIELLEGEFVVVARGEGIEEVVVGDIVRSVDGVDAPRAFREAESQISGSPQWRRRKGLRQMGRGPAGSDATLQLERDGEIVSATLARSDNTGLVEPRPDDIEELEDGIYYVNLCEVEYAEDDIPLHELAAASGIIFDLRGYPNAFTERFLGHLTEESLDCAQWLTPQAIYPDQERRVGWDEGGRWQVEPREPRFSGCAVFLTDAGAISYAESIMGIIEHYELGPIVGQPTAGTNGNVNSCYLPGRGRLQFTGMKVLKHDGSQHHLIGIRPTHPVEKTIDAIRDGRDEVLERALELVDGAYG